MQQKPLLQAEIPDVDKVTILNECWESLQAKEANLQARKLTQAQVTAYCNCS